LGGDIDFFVEADGALVGGDVEIWGVNFQEGDGCFMVGDEEIAVGGLDAKVGEFARVEGLADGLEEAELGELSVGDGEFGGASDLVGEREGAREMELGIGDPGGFAWLTAGGGGEGIEVGLSERGVEGEGGGRGVKIGGEGSLDGATAKGGGEGGERELSIGVSEWGGEIFEDESFFPDKAIDGGEAFDFFWGDVGGVQLDIGGDEAREEVFIEEFERAAEEFGVAELGEEGLEIGGV
jgi:hypothetical protein